MYKYLNVKTEVKSLSGNDGAGLLQLSNDNTPLPLFLLYARNSRGRKFPGYVK